MGVLLFAFVRAILWNPPERASRSIKLHAASPAQGQSTRFAQGRGVARTATNPVLRSAVNTSAAAALSGTVKPALSRPLGVSTNTRIMAVLPPVWKPSLRNVYWLALI
jgi:hypothetical protein